jgi:hypothetical protein
MNYLIEAIFVGIYTSLIYLLFSPFIKNFYVLLLVCGFFKHLLGSIIGIWTWYCNNGDACVKVLRQDQQYKSNNLRLISETIYEAFIFLIVGSILSFIVKNEIYLFFIMGIILHIMGEYSGIHKKFCRNACDKID